METYSFLRHMADSWGLLAMFVLFLGVSIWVFRPGVRKAHDEAANSIFRHDKRPAAEARNPDLTEA